MLRFAYPDFLWLLVLIPVFGLLFILRLNWKRKAIKRFGDPELMARLMPDKSDAKTKWKFFLLAGAYLFLVIGLSNPQIGSRYEEVKRQGVDLIIALDVSNSMLAEDIRPNRLERAKQAIGKLLEKFGDDRIGIVVFAGDAYLQLPFTQDYAAAKLFLSNVTQESILSQGTALGAAIETAVRALPRGGKRNKAIIVISDGENHEDNAVEAAGAAREAGIFVHTLGIGAEQGAPVPDFSNGIMNGYKKDQDGNTVISRMNPAMLMEVSAAGGGKFVQASSSDVGLDELFSQINSMQKTDFGSKTFTDYADRFPLFLSAALLLLLIELLISERKSALAKRLNLFGNNKK
jgi:Ca-activated chloride channel family protein